MNNLFYMKNIIIRSIIILAGLALSTFDTDAQSKCVIKGTIGNDSLRYTKEKVSKLYLIELDEYDRSITVDSANVVNGQFQFTRNMEEGAPVLMYLIGGFDNGYVNFFMEPGEIDIYINNAAYPGGAKVKGTKTNDLYREFKQISADCVREQSDSLKVILKEKGEKWLESEEGMNEWSRIGASSLIDANIRRIQFLIEHNDSPMTPLMLEKEIYYLFDKEYAKVLSGVVSPKLEKHPYNISFQNTVKSLDLRVGGEVPNVMLKLANGQKKYLNDYRGKYVLLDFWASWCGPCIREIPHLKQIYDEFASKSDKLTIISVSLDDKENSWREAMKSHDIDRQGWVHASDLLGWKAPSATLLGVKAIPQIILLDPEGKAISFTLRGEELVRRIRQILSGDLYYQNGGKK